MVETINKFTHTYRRLTQELAREPLIEELALELGADARGFLGERSLFGAHGIQCRITPFVRFDVAGGQ